MNPRYPEVARRAGRRCEYCRAPEVIFNFPFEVEHVVPPGHGGTDDPMNLALACRACNCFKGDALVGLDDETGREEVLFNPRTDRWGEHLQVDHDSGAIVGSTPCGRATAHRLRLNDPAHITARLVWIELGVFT